MRRRLTFVDRAASPSAKEFDQLVRPHVRAFYRVAYRWTGDVERAEDLVQELLVRLFAKLDELRTLDQVRPWALGVMYRMFVDQLRRERSSPVEFGYRSSNDDEGDDSPLVDPRGDSAIIVERKLMQDHILAVWMDLPQDHRMVLTMHDIEGYSLIDISQMTDAPLGTLKSRLHRARAKLRSLLQGSFGQNSSDHDCTN
jgi:RNA polymerase sigma factor (sigma-70 family)